MVEAPFKLGFVPVAALTTAGPEGCSHGLPSPWNPAPPTTTSPFTGYRKVRQMAGSFTSFRYHIVFSTKGRQPMLTPDVAPRVHAYLAGIVREIGGTCVVVGGTADHIPMLAEVRKAMSFGEAMRNIKGAHQGGSIR